MIIGTVQPSYIYFILLILHDLSFSSYIAEANGLLKSILITLLNDDLYLTLNLGFEILCRCVFLVLVNNICEQRKM